jgi:hypothetical protein
MVTRWSKEVAAPNPAYGHIRAAWWDEHFKGTTTADPEGVRQAMLDPVDSDEPPLRLLLGSYCLSVVHVELVVAELRDRLGVAVGHLSLAGFAQKFPGCGSLNDCPGGPAFSRLQ